MNVISAEFKVSEYAFAVDIEKFVNKAMEDTDKFVTKVVANTAFELTEESPIGDPSLWKKPIVPPGYTPGHFLLNWQLGVDSAPTNEIQGEDPDRANAITRIGAEIPKDAAGHTYYLVNNASYARALEDGHSGQAPEGWVEKTAMRFDKIIERSL